jgi:hypothetical protein
VTREPVEILRGLERARNGRADRNHAERDDAANLIVEIVGSGGKVLYVGHPALPLIRELQRRACDVVLVLPGGSDDAGALSVFCEQVISRPIGAAGLVAELPEGQFDAVVLDGEPATASTLCDLLPAVEHVLNPNGVVICSPEVGTPETGPGSIAAVLGAARFVTVRVDESPSAETVADDLLASVRRRVPVRPVNAAYRVPHDELGLINRHVQALARSAELADAVPGLEQRVEDSEEARRNLEHERDGILCHLEASEETRRTLEYERDVAQADAAALRHLNKRLADRDEQLRELLLDAHEQLLQRDEELTVALARQLELASPAETGHASSHALGYLRYRRVIARVRELVDEAVPSDAVVAVASKGDDDLLDLGGRVTWHLPQTEDGVYLGRHPADGGEAVDQLEYLRDRGAQFLVIPGSVWWWLDHYVELREHLDAHYATVAREEGVCVVVDLREPRAAEPEPEPESELERVRLVAQVRHLVSEVVPEGSTVAVVTHGDDDLLQLDGRTGRHLPQAEGGVYAGYHPADSVTAIAQLEVLREEGATYLVIPATQLWWLDYYGEFAQHLNRRYRLASRRAEAGVVYDLSRRSPLRPWRNRAR